MSTIFGRNLCNAREINYRFSIRVVFSAVINHEHGSTVQFFSYISHLKIGRRVLDRGLE